MSPEYGVSLARFFLGWGFLVSALVVAILIAGFIIDPDVRRRFLRFVGWVRR